MSSVTGKLSAILSILVLGLGVKAQQTQQTPPPPQPKTRAYVPPRQQTQPQQRSVPNRPQAPDQPNARIRNTPQRQGFRNQPGPASVPQRVLTPLEASQFIAKRNRQRASFSGVNRAPLPPGQVIQNPDRSVRLNSADGRNFLLRPSGSIMSYNRGNQHALFDSGGRVAALRTPDISINRSSIGAHVIAARQANGGMALSYGPHYGYVEQPVMLQNQRFFERIAVVNSQTSVSLYRPLAYSNMQLNIYVPGTYYGAGFYGWISTPWVMPVAYQWGWSATPVERYYGDYYAPPPAVSAPDQWMAEYVISTNLQDAYSQEQVLNQRSMPVGMGEDMPVVTAPVSAPITPEVKQAVVAQVDQVVASEKAEAAQVPPDGRSAVPPPPAREIPAGLDPLVKIFIVSNTLQVMTGGDQCRLTQGDVLMLPQPAVTGALSASLIVKSSLKGDCPGNSQVTVGVPDLQEMSNHFRENIASAEEKLASGQGTPRAPEATPLVSAVGKPSQGQATAANEVLDHLQVRANQEETSVAQELAAGGAVH